MEYSMTFLARGVWGSLPMVTMSGPDWTIFSTSRRILRRSMSRFLRTLAATPEPSLTRPRRMCSVPMYSWLKRWASWLASCITLRARSVKRSYIPESPLRLGHGGPAVDHVAGRRGRRGLQFGHGTHAVDHAISEASIHPSRLASIRPRQACVDHPPGRL